MFIITNQKRRQEGSWQGGVRVAGAFVLGVLQADTGKASG